MITIILADDHAVVRDGLRMTLDGYDDLRVLGDAANGLEAIRLAEKLQPDVVVLDIAMPQLNGIDAIPQIRQAAPAAQVVILSMHSNPEYALRALEAGGLAYVLKESAAREGADASCRGHYCQPYSNPPISDAPIN